MTPIDMLLARNQRFADTHHTPLPLMPTLPTIVISCLDARADPAHILGLQAGESVVLRNAGGRITPAIEAELALLLAMVRRGAPDLKPAICLIHHADCGLERLAATHVSHAVAQSAGLPPESVARIAIHDHNSSLREDTTRLRASSHIPNGLRILGLLLDHTSGRLETVVDEVL